MSEFYVGYLPKAPKRLGRQMLRWILLLNALAVAVAAVLALAQSPFAASKFEFLQYRDYEGGIAEFPYPMLVTRDGRYLLAASGKHGANELVRGLDGRQVRLSGSLIQRGEQRMLEVRAGSVVSHSGTFLPDSEHSLGEVTLRGEIVDSKCYLGVMNPGSGKVHRSCAARCLSGGIPPLFVVRDASGEFQTFLLTRADGSTVGKEILRFAGEPLELTGEVARRGGVLLLKARE